MAHLDIFQIYNTFPSEWRKLLTQTTRSHTAIFDEIAININKWVKVSNVKTKDIGKRLANAELKLNPISIITARHKENLNFHMNPFITARKSQKDIKLRNLQYKMLHNIYPTMNHLYKWKIKDTPNCSLCNVPETLKHAVFDCPVAARVWENLKGILDMSNTFEYADILLGFSSTKSLNVSLCRSYSLDTLLILLKQRLILQRENKVHIDRDRIINLIVDRCKLEKYNSSKNDQIIRYINRWKWIEDFCSS